MRPDPQSLCVIPARGGSIRLPNKNIRPMQGLPMIAHTIKCAQQCGIFQDIYVSTDSSKIAAIAREYGAKTPVALPESIAEPDQASMSACVFMHDYLVEKGHGPFELLFCLQPTSPLKEPQDIINAWEKMQNPIYEHMVSVTPIDPHYHHWAMKQENDFLAPVFGPEYQVDRLYLPKAFRPNGACKIMRKKVIGKHETFFDSNKIGFFEMPEERSIHVAFEMDFLLAEFLLNQREKQERERTCPKT